ncbi:unnamed protein product [Discosporangium mesarthrocarpum]
MGNCSSQGECCSIPPPRVETDDNGVQTRVNLMYEPQTCCGTSMGLSKEDVEMVPEQLRVKGLADVEWRTWTGPLKLGAVQRLRSGVCTDIEMCFSAVLMPWLMFELCADNRNSVMAWDEALRKWQKDFNEVALEKHGIFVKTQSICIITNKRKSSSRHKFRWLEFALTPDEIEKLRAEPHLTGDIRTGCCGEVNETECCMHP